jgi:hypothetical protein
VIGFENLYSMQLVKCVLCKNKEASQTGSDLKKSDVKDRRKGDILSSKKSQDEGTCNKRLVMFPASQSEQLNLQIGSQFKIFPPWYTCKLLYICLIIYLAYSKNSVAILLHFVASVA